MILLIGPLARAAEAPLPLGPVMDSLWIGNLGLGRAGKIFRFLGIPVFFDLLEKHKQFPTKAHHYSNLLFGYVMDNQSGLVDSRSQR